MRPRPVLKRLTVFIGNCGSVPTGVFDELDAQRVLDFMNSLSAKSARRRGPRSVAGLRREPLELLQHLEGNALEIWAWPLGLDLTGHVDEPL